MIKMLKILLIILISLGLTSCTSENSLFSVIFEKQFNLISNINEKINNKSDYVYNSLDECKSEIGYSLADFTVYNNNAKYNIVLYADADDYVIMHLFNSDVAYNYNNVFEIVSQNDTGENIQLFIKQYGNLINEIKIGSETERLRVSFDLSSLFSNMNSLKKVTFLNCDISEAYPYMDYIFQNDAELKEVEFINCDTLNLKSMKNAFDSCISLQVCDFSTSSFRTNLVIDDLFNNIDLSKLTVYTLHQEILSSYPKSALDTYVFKIYNNAIFDYEPVYQNLENVIFKENGFANNELSPNKNKIGDIFWAVYADSKNEVYLYISNFNSTIKCEDDNLFRLIDIGFYTVDCIKQEWKKYKNLITQVNMVCFPLDDQIRSSFSMNGWFKDMDQIKNMYISGYHCMNSFYAKSLFENCCNLETIDFVDCDFRLCNSMDKMFKNCKKLSELNLNCFNNCFMPDTEQMFFGCSNNLKISCLNEAFNQEFERDVFKLYNIETLGINYSYEYEYENRYEVKYKEFDLCADKMYSNYMPTDAILIWYVVENNGTFYLRLSDMNMQFSKNEGYRLVDCGYYRDVCITQEWKKYGNLINRIDLYFNRVEYPVNSLDFWFNNMDNLYSALLQFSDDNNIVSINGLFLDCCHLSGIDFVNIDLSALQEATLAFCGCSTLRKTEFTNTTQSSSIDLIHSFDDEESIKLQKTMNGFLYWKWNW